MFFSSLLKIQKGWYVKVTFEESKFKKFVSRSALQTSLNFKNPCYNLKTRGLGGTAFVAFLLF